MTQSKEVRQWNDKSGIVAVSPDLASGRGPVRLRELPSGKEVARLDYPEIRALAFSPDGKNLAVAPHGLQGGYVHKVPGGEKVTHFGTIIYRDALEWPALAYAPDGSFLVCVHPVLGLTFLNTDSATGKRSRFSWEQEEYKHAAAVACSPDSKSLAVGWRQYVSLWDIASVKERFRFPGHKEVVAVVFSPDGTTVTARYRDGTALIWRTKEDGPR